MLSFPDKFTFTSRIGMKREVFKKKDVYEQPQKSFLLFQDIIKEEKEREIEDMKKIVGDKKFY